MSKLTWFQRLYWQHLSKPVELRPIILHLLEHPVSSILEIGIGDASRITRLLQHHSLKPESNQLRYAAIDLFEGSTGETPKIKLKDAYRILSERHVKTHLIPGDILNGLLRVVHTVLPSDLVIVDASIADIKAHEEAIKQWLPRLVHKDSVVFMRDGEKCSFQKLETAPNAIYEIASAKQAA